MSRHDTAHATEALPKLKTKEPPLYKVILLNDDFTPMDFVVELIRRFFNKSEEEATLIMLSIHHSGFGVCGVYPRDVAETKVIQVNQYARTNNHPLKCVLEKS